LRCLRAAHAIASPTTSQAWAKIIMTLAASGENADPRPGDDVARLIKPGRFGGFQSTISFVGRIAV